jgi:hypothetical protein
MAEIKMMACYNENMSKALNTYYDMQIIAETVEYDNVEGIEWGVGYKAEAYRIDAVIW